MLQNRLCSRVRHMRGRRRRPNNNLSKVCALWPTLLGIDIDSFTSFEVRSTNITKTHRAMPSLLASLSPIKHSPPSASASFALASSSRSKENQPAPQKEKPVRTTRKPLGPRGPSPPTSPASAPMTNASAASREIRLKQQDKENIPEQKAARALRDVTARSQNIEPANLSTSTSEANTSS